MLHSHLLEQKNIETMKSSICDIGSPMMGAYHKEKKHLSFDLLLTSLVDAFAILAIFLLANTTSYQQEVEADQNIQLPVVTSAASISEGTLITRTAQGWALDGKPVAMDELVAKLKELKEQGKETEFNLIVQADKNISYEELNPIILASAHAGIESFKFAAVEEGEKK